MGHAAGADGVIIKVPVRYVGSAGPGVCRVRAVERQWLRVGSPTRVGLNGRDVTVGIGTRQPGGELDLFVSADPPGPAFDLEVTCGMRADGAVPATCHSTTGNDALMDVRSVDYHASNLPWANRVLVQRAGAPQGPFRFEATQRGGVVSLAVTTNPEPPARYSGQGETWLIPVVETEAA